jgi:hypothetical protein
MGMYLELAGVRSPIPGRICAVPMVSHATLRPLATIDRSPFRGAQGDDRCAAELNRRHPLSRFPGEGAGG